MEKLLCEIKSTTANSHLAKAGDYGNDTPGSSLKFLLHLINLCFKIPAFAKWRNVGVNLNEKNSNICSNRDDFGHYVFRLLCLQKRKLETLAQLQTRREFGEQQWRER